MKKLLLVSVCILALLLCACNSSSGSAPLTPEQQVYINYLETGKTDFEAALNSYCQSEIHYIESPPEEKEFRITGYEVLEWEQLNDQLWAVKAFIISNHFPDGQTVYNFVGIVDGEYSVLRNVRSIPDALKEGLDLDRFISPNAL